MQKHEQEKPDSEKKKAENTTESQIEKQSKEVHLLSESASFQGPLPPPAMYGEYEKVHPGIAKGLFDMAKEEQNHRIEWENTVLRATVKETTRGQWFGFIIAIFCIGVSGSLALGGHRLVPSLIAGTCACALVWQFVQKKKK